jgi:hypothetical protein
MLMLYHWSHATWATGRFVQQADFLFVQGMVRGLQNVA